MAAACGDDSGTEPAGTSGGTGTPASTSTAADGGPGGETTTAPADSSGGPGSDGSSGGSGSSGGGSTSTGAAVDCDLLAPIQDPPDPQPMTGACGYALPMPNEDCGPQPVPGSQVCAAFIEAFDPTMDKLPEMTDWRCGMASSGGYCLELGAGLYTFCTMPVTTLEDYENECITCFIEIPKDGAITVSWEEGPTWDVPECVDIGMGSSGSGG
ncbi:MAG: hypothetical protein AAF721_06610 [Myxococcota bacterium]